MPELQEIEKLESEARKAEVRLYAAEKKSRARGKKLADQTARVVITAGGIASGMEMGFHLLRRAGYDEEFISEVARVMEYAAAYDRYRDDREQGGAEPALRAC